MDLTVTMHVTNTDMDMGIYNGLLFACRDKNIREMSIRNTSGDPLGSPKELNIVPVTASRFHSSIDYLGKTQVTRSGYASRRF